MKPILWSLVLTAFISMVAEAQPAFINDGLIAFYPFNGNLNDTSEKGNTLKGEVRYTANRIGEPENAVIFDKNTSVQTEPINVKGKSFSMSLWFQLTKTPQLPTETIVCLGTENKKLFILNVDINKNILFSYSENIEGFSSYGIKIPAKDVVVNQWQHIFLTSDNLYFNGLVVDKIRPPIGDVVAPFVVGGFLNQYFNSGLIDDIRIYDRNLSDYEVKEIYRFEKVLMPNVVIEKQPDAVVSELGLKTQLSVSLKNATEIQWYKNGRVIAGQTNEILTVSQTKFFDIGDYQATAKNPYSSITSKVASVNVAGENPGVWKNIVAYFPLNGTIKDESGGNNFITEGSFQFMPSASSELGQAYFSSPKSESLRLGNNPTLTQIGEPGSEFTISFLFSPDKASDSGNIITDFNPQVNPWQEQVCANIRLNKMPNSNFKISVNRKGNYRAESGILMNWMSDTGLVGDEIPPGKWVHVAVCVSSVRDGQNRLYIDGVLVSEFKSNAYYGGRANWEIAPGDENGKRPIIALDQLKFYDRTLTDGNIADLYRTELLDSRSGSKLAIASCQIVNGFVVSVNLVSGGFGYTKNPSVKIMGGGGAGATATANQINGIVTSISITNPGSGYTSAPIITIEPPPFPPRKATSTAQVVNGFVVGTKITDGGFGYDSPPAILLVGGGGSGATAVATVENGTVTAINITNPGSGYTSAPHIRVASPPFTPKLSIDVTRVRVRLEVVLGRKYQIESSADLQVWTKAGDAFVAQDEILQQDFDVDISGRYFRINQVP
jgi:hypothetical protein